MPIHDWPRVRADRFHHFHQDWTTGIARALNAGVLADGYSALAEQVTGGPEPDVVTLSLPGPPVGPAGGVAVADAPVRTRVQTEAEAAIYARKVNRVTVHHPDGVVVAVIEIVSPGNKDSRHAAGSFARKAAEFLFAGVHLLIVDLFPPTRRDPQGVHKLIWDRIRDEPFELPPGQATDSRCLRRRGPDPGLRRAGGGRRRTPGPADFPHPGPVRPVPAERDLRAVVGGVPEGTQGAARSPGDMTHAHPTNTPASCPGKASNPSIAAPSVSAAPP